MCNFSSINEQPKTPEIFHQTKQNISGDAMLSTSEYTTGVIPSRNEFKPTSHFFVIPLKTSFFAAEKF